MHVVRDRAHIVEELRVNGPTPIFSPDRFPNDVPARLLDRVDQREPSIAGHTIAQSFIRRPIFISCGCCRTEPTFIDPATIESVSVQIVRMKLKPPSGLQVGPRHPAWRKAQQPTAFLKGGIDQRTNVRIYFPKGSRCFHVSGGGWDELPPVPEVWNAHSDDP